MKIKVFIFSSLTLQICSFIHETLLHKFSDQSRNIYWLHKHGKLLPFIQSVQNRPQFAINSVLLIEAVNNLTVPEQ